MTCREVIEFLMDYLVNDLPAPERAVFDAHLAECPECVAYLKTYQEAVELSKAALDPPAVEPAPEELVQAILAARRQRG